MRLARSPESIRVDPRALKSFETTKVSLEKSPAAEHCSTMSKWPQLYVLNGIRL